MFYCWVFILINKSLWSSHSPWPILYPKAFHSLTVPPSTAHSLPTEPQTTQVPENQRGQEEVQGERVWIKAAPCLSSQNLKLHILSDPSVPFLKAFRKLTYKDAIKAVFICKRNYSCSSPMVHFSDHWTHQAFPWLRTFTFTVFPLLRIPFLRSLNHFFSSF